MHDHLYALAVDIGERSVSIPQNLNKTAAYISSYYRGLGLTVNRQAYSYGQMPVDNIIAEISFVENPGHYYLVGAHYDSVGGTVGADDNAGAVAVHLPVIKLTVPFNGWVMPAVRLSDHASFWDQGFKAVMVTDSAFYRNPCYHTPADTTDKLDFGYMAELVESLMIFFLSHHR